MVQISPTCDIKTFRVARCTALHINYTIRSTLRVLFGSSKKIPSPTCEKLVEIRGGIFWLNGPSPMCDKKEMV